MTGREILPRLQQIIDVAGVKRLPLPPRSPNLNAYAERWVRSVKDEALSHLILLVKFPAACAQEYVAHYLHERNHQGKGNVLPFLHNKPRLRACRPDAVSRTAWGPPQILRGVKPHEEVVPLQDQTVPRPPCRWWGMQVTVPRMRPLDDNYHA